MGKYNEIIKSLAPFLKNQNHYTEHGKKVSNAQIYKRKNILINGFRRLRDSQYRLNNVNNFRGRHFTYLFNSWMDQNLSASEIQNRASVFRVFGNIWLKKPGMIEKTEHYAGKNYHRVKRTAAATESRCWSDKNINPIEKIEEVSQYDQRVGIQLELQLVFLLRKKESFLLKPHQADFGELLHVQWGTKGDRERIVNIDNCEKKELIKRAKIITKNENDSMIPAEKSLRQWESHYNYVLRKFGITRAELGVTSHGLRHEGANKMYEKITGEKSSVQGGSIPVTKKKLIEYAKDSISHQLGHARRDITSWYIGKQN